MAYNYARREELAKQKGFASYTEYRSATEYAKGTGRFAGTRSAKDFRLFSGAYTEKTPNIVADARAYWLAFGRPSHSKGQTKYEDTYSVVTDKNGDVIIGRNGKGAKAYWLIKIAGAVPTVEVWRALYPTGRRN